MTSDELTALRAHIAKRIRISEENLARREASMDPADTQRVAMLSVYRGAMAAYAQKLATLSALTEADSVPTALPLEPQFGG
jgi:hypothetical protein